MATEPFDYGKYFEELQKVNLSVRLGVEAPLTAAPP